MPTYNEAVNVEEAIQSILNQSYERFELIVIDGGSIDDTVERVRQFSDERIQILREDRPQGRSNALNRGISQSTGDYIARMDADDRSEPNRLEHQVRTLDSVPSVKIVSCWYRVLGCNGEPITFHRVDPRRSFTVDDLIKHGPGFAGGSVMLRRETLESLDGFSEGLHTAEDLDLYLRIAERNGGDAFYIVPRVLYEHRLSVDQITRRRRHRLDEKRAKEAALERRRGKRKEPTMTTAAPDQVSSESYTETQQEALYEYLKGIAYLQAEEVGPARIQFLRAVLTSPTLFRPWYKLGLSLFPKTFRKEVNIVIQKMINRLHRLSDRV